MFMVRSAPVPCLTRYSTNCNSSPSPTLNLENNNYYKNDPLAGLPAKVRQFVASKAKLCEPDNIYICDGSESENSMLIDKMVAAGILIKLPKYKNW